MSDQVFGNVITDAMVKKMDMSITNITARHRGEVAVRYMYSDTKANEARAFVDDLARRFGSGVSTRCSIYNATGSTLTFVRCHTWEGKTWVSPYPHIIQNGQWATFLHARDSRSSKEAVVYRGRNNAGNIREWLLAWDTRLTDIPNQNRVYTEVHASTI